MTKYAPTVVDRAKAEAIVGLLVTLCEGPREAFATLVVAAKITVTMSSSTKEFSDEQIIADFAIALNSMHSTNEATQ